MQKYKQKQTSMTQVCWLQVTHFKYNKIGRLEEKVMVNDTEILVKGKEWLY